MSAKGGLNFWVKEKINEEKNNIFDPVDRPDFRLFHP